MLPTTRATFIGMIAPVFWGIAVTTLKGLQGEIGPLATLGGIALCTGTCSLTYTSFRGQLPALRAAFGNRFFYIRWVCFVGHEALLVTALFLVRKEHIAFVILLNYLWPSAVIVCSILWASVKITRWFLFLAGSTIVVCSLVLETLGPQGLPAGLFSAPMDRLAYTLVLVGALSWGVYSAITRRTGEASGGSAVLPVFQLTNAIALALAFLPQLAVAMNLTFIGLIELVVYSLASFVAYLAWDHGMQRGNIVVLSLCSDFVPWLSLGTAVLMLGLHIETYTIASAILLVFGAIVTRLGTMPKREKTGGRG
jgi:drug/metabolite transporter (DMT)-like permease